MMTYKFLITLMGISLLFTACSPAGSPAAATPEAIPVVKADTAIIAEGRLEPVHFAEIAFNASGVIGEVLAGEGEQVKKGQPLIRLGNESDTNYATAQLELVSAQKALNDLLNSSGTDLAQAVIDLQDAKEAYQKADNYRNSLDAKMWLQRITWKQVGRQSIPVAHWYRGYAAPETIADADNDLAMKKAELEAAQRTYERLKDGADADQLAVLQARLEAAKAGVAAFSRYGVTPSPPARGSRRRSMAPRSAVGSDRSPRGRRGTPRSPPGCPGSPSACRARSSRRGRSP